MSYKPINLHSKLALQNLNDLFTFFTPIKCIQMHTKNQLEKKSVESHNKNINVEKFCQHFECLTLAINNILLLLIMIPYGLQIP